MPENKVYYGDNLDVLRRYVKDESVDLVYLDPPFNSRQGYNVLFAEKDGTRSAAQIMAFEDTWEWNQESARIYEQVVEEGGSVAAWPPRSHQLLYGEEQVIRLKGKADAVGKPKHQCQSTLVSPSSHNATQLGKM